MKRLLLIDVFYRNVVALDHLNDAGDTDQQPAALRGAQTAAPFGVMSGVNLVRNNIYAHLYDFSPHLWNKKQNKVTLF